MIIGDLDDPHVAAVTNAVAPAGLLVIDANNLARTSYSVDLGGPMLLETAGTTYCLDPEIPIRGWIRRVAPPDWHQRVTLESVASAEMTSWLTLLGGISRNFGVEWLTPLDRLIAAENKISQYIYATRLGIAVPRTMVSNDADLLASEFSMGAVVKPLGPGHFYSEDGTPMVVFAQHLPQESVRALDFTAAPFLVQEQVAASSHLRIVTVGNRVWCCEIAAAGRPLDWRADDAAHHDFVVRNIPRTLIDQALTIASAFGLRYSSQDWIEHGETFTFLDLNPAGQWLFLPDPVDVAVSQALADWLNGGSE